MDRLRRGILAIGLLCLGCSAASAVTLDVRAVVDHRGSLAGQRISVEGFLLRMGDYYFLAEGRRGSGREGVAGGKTYVCDFKGAPNMLWFSAGDIDGGGLEQEISDYGPGRHAVVSGIFRNETSGIGRDVSPLLLRSGREFADEQIGPLRRVRAVKLLRERCDG